MLQYRLPRDWERLSQGADRFCFLQAEPLEEIPARRVGEGAEEEVEIPMPICRKRCHMPCSAWRASPHGVLRRRHAWAARSLAAMKSTNTRTFAGMNRALGYTA
jgi:hypothetical protein